MPEMIPVNDNWNAIERCTMHVGEYRRLVELAERYRILSYGLMKAMFDNGTVDGDIYPVIDQSDVLQLIRSVCPIEFMDRMAELREEKDRKRMQKTGDAL